MKNIAIFVSGTGEAAERIVKLFNEGNRLKTVLVVVDDSAVALMNKLEGEDVELLHIPDSEWHQRSGEVAALLKEKEVCLIVLDDFALFLSDEILEATAGEMIRVSSAELAPREVVAALEADLRKPKEEVVEVDVEEENPTPESEWANALKIQFTPPKVPVNPPEIPEEDQTEVNRDNAGSYQETGYNPGKPYNNPYYYQGSRNRKSQINDRPMPSTWLVWSVLVTVFCCFIPGIVAIIFSSQVSSRYYAGDYEGAERASRAAEIWIIVSFVLGVLAATLYIPFMLIG